MICNKRACLCVYGFQRVYYNYKTLLNQQVIPQKQYLKFVSSKYFHRTIFYPPKRLFKQVSGLYYSSFSPLLEISHQIADHGIFKRLFLEQRSVYLTNLVALNVLCSVVKHLGWAQSTKEMQGETRRSRVFVPTSFSALAAS